MLTRFIQVAVLLLCLSLTSFASHSSPLYQQYQTYQDANGNIYLQLPKQFVLIHSDISIPLHVYPKNALVKLSKINGVWTVEILTEAQFNALTNLTPSDYDIEYIDFSGDGDTEVVVRSHSDSIDSFILYGLENGQVSFSVHNKYEDGVDLSKYSGAKFIDVNGDGYKDIQYDDYTLLGNAQDKFFNTSRYEISQTDLIGATGGDFRVAEDGSATYQIPLKLPQGVAGVTPQMSFSYSSNGGDSVLGRGWMLSGLTSISRCPKNYAQDGYIAGVSLSINDEYCLNGQRLILASGTHGINNATYHTEFANFSVIKISSANENGAKSFEVTTKSGEKHYFGISTANSNAYGGNSSAPSVYLIATIEDIKNNQINYHYTHHNTVDEVNLDKITWGAINNLNELKVNYFSRHNPRYGYRFGRESGQTKFIQNVEIKQSSELIRRYNIAWDHGTVQNGNENLPVAENISRITDIQECLIDANNEKCLTASSFNWSSLQTGSRTVKVCTKYFDLEDEGEDYDGSGYRPRCIEWEDRTVTASFTPFGSSKLISLSDEFRNSEVNIPADADGDGISDIYFINNNKWSLIKISASGEGTSRYLSRSYVNSSYDRGKYEYAQVADINGDGRMEVIYPDSGRWYKLYLTSSGSLARTYIGTYSGKNYEKTVLLDVDGDSFIDMVTKRDTGLFVRYNNAGTLNSYVNSLVSNNISVNNFGSASKIHLQTPKLKNTAFLDINGDGISDFLSKGTFPEYHCEKYINGGGQLPFKQAVKSTSSPQVNSELNSSGYWSRVYSGLNRSEVQAECTRIGNTNPNGRYRVMERSISRPVALIGSVNSNGVPNYNEFYPLNFLYSIDLEKDVRIADFNGDGLSDIIYRQYEKWQMAMSRGDGSFTYGTIPTSILNASDRNKYNYHRFVDINSDGLTDLLSYKGSSFTVYLAQANKGAIPSFINRLTIAVDVDDNKQMHFADFDGDSQLDILFEQASKMKYMLAAQPLQRKNVIDLVTSGFGQTTEIQYGLLQNGDTRIQSSSSYFDSLANAQRSSSDTNYNTFYKSDFFQSNIGMWVVTNVANVGYDSYGNYQDDTDRNKAISIGYRYSGMLLHKLGRGSLGFERLETTDNTTGIKTTTKYSQAYPYIGMPISTIQSYNNKTLSEATNTFNQTNSTKFGKFPYVDIATDKKWRLLTNNTTAFDSRSVLDSNYDTFGNLTRSISKQFPALTGSYEIAKVQTVNIYNGAGGGAEKGRLSSTSVTHTRSTESLTRSSTFGYESNGMLAWSKINGLNLKTTYDYNGFGSKERVCVIDENTNESRCSSTQWTPDGRFVLSATNAIGQSESYLYNGQSGSVNGRIWSKTVTGPNGIASTQYFDIQGQLVKEQRADGTTGTITRAYSSSTHLGNCVANTTNKKLCFSETRNSSGKPSSTVWFDAYGRKVKTQTKAFDGNRWSSQYNTFDMLSRGKTTSEPYYENSLNGLAPTSTNIDKTTFTYDVLGRVTQEQLPDGAINKRRYNALQNIYTDAEQNTRIETISTLGELTKVTSPIHTTITQETSSETSLQSKDAFSSISRASVPVPPTPGPLPPTQTTLIRSITDYQYNVLGKLTKVSNYASNNTNNKVSIHTVYDTEGRKTAMYDPDKGHWTYSYNAFGELVTQTSANNLVSTHYYDLLGRKVKSTEQALANYSATVNCYHYGTSKANKSVGKLIKQQQFTTANSALNNFNCASNINTNATWQQSISFDQYGRLANTTTTFEGKTFTQSQKYDAYSRVSTQTLPQGLVVNTQYQYGYLKRIKQGNLTLREITAMDAAGRVTAETIGAGMSKSNTFDQVGRVESINLTKTNGQLLHSLSYHYDYVGNLTQRNQNYAGNINFSESFVYDSINRVKERGINYSNLDVTQLEEAFAYQQNYEYDFIGNITRKYNSELISGGLPFPPSPSPVETEEVNLANSYTYNYQWQTHSDSTTNYPLKRRGLHNIKKGSNNNYRNYSYDANGNVTNDGSREFKYTPFDKPWLITSGAQTSEFKYANRSRYLRLDNIQEQQPNGSNYSGLTQYKTHYVGAYERVERTGGAGNKIEHKYQIAGAVLTRKEGESNFSTLFAHTDYQGSVITVTDQAGQMAEQFIYDPWGKKTKVIINNNVGSLVSSLTRATATTRGYTGHEGIDHFELIHMNGRVYDADIGRFLQADPNIQAPTNSQNYNRYSYVLNNPMSYTDPSGYFFSKLWKKVKQYASVIVGVALVYFTGGAASWFVSSWYGAAAAGAISGAVGSAVNGGNIFTGALKGAFSAAAFYGVGSAFGEVAAGSAAHVGKTLAHGITGGVMSVLQGGKFGHGFASAGVTQAFAPSINGINKGSRFSIGRIAAAAVVGGTASKLSGGKFANGATTGAFSRMFNDESHHKAKKNYKMTIAAHLDGPDDKIGHAIAILTDAEGNQLSRGFWPKDGMDAKGFLSGSEVEGAMFNETDTEYLQAFNEYQKTGVDPMGGSWSSKTFSIDQAQYQAGLKYIDNVAISQPKYSSFYMCGSFARGVLNSTGNYLSPHKRGYYPSPSNLNILLGN